MPNKRLVPVTALSCLLAALLTIPAWAAPEGAAKSTAAVPPLATVEVQALGAGAVERVGLDAVVEAVRQTTLSAQVAGAVGPLRVKAGDSVKAGQVLLRTDAHSASQSAAASDAQVQAALASLNVASRDYERQKQLFQKQYISQSALDKAQAQWQASQAQVKALQAQAGVARTQSGFFVLNAPYAGVISQVPITLGDMAMPGRALLTMYDPSELRVTAAVAQSVAAALNDTSAVRLELPSLATGLLPPTRVQVLPVVDAATHTAELRLGLPGELKGVSPGLFARVWLPVGPIQGATFSSQRFYVPAGAVVRRSEVTGLYVLDAQGQPLLRQVRLGRAQGDKVEVLSGVSQGDKVVIDPQQAAARVR